MGSATLNLLLTDNNTKVLQSPRIRATDAQKATMKIGSKIPIATGSYQTGAATALVSSLVNTQFQYQDVGVNIEMTPSVHYDHDVTLKIKIEVSAESGTETISGVTEPIISQRVDRPGHPPARGRGQHPGRHSEQAGTQQLDRRPRIERHPHPQVHLRFQGPHHSGRRHCLRGGAAYRALAGTGPGQPARHRHRPGPVRSSCGMPTTKDAAPAVCPRRAPCRSSAPPLEPFPHRARSRPRRRCWRSCAPIWTPMAAPHATAQAGCAATPVNSAAQPPAAAPPPAAAIRRDACLRVAASLALNVPATPMASGTTFQVPIVLNGGTDVASVALQIALRPCKAATGKRSRPETS